MVTEYPPKEMPEWIVTLHQQWKEAMLNEEVSRREHRVEYSVKLINKGQIASGILKLSLSKIPLRLGFMNSREESLHIPIITSNQHRSKIHVALTESNKHLIQGATDRRHAIDNALLNLRLPEPNRVNELWHDTGGFFFMTYDYQPVVEGKYSSTDIQIWGGGAWDEWGRDTGESEESIHAYFTSPQLTLDHPRIYAKKLLVETGISLTPIPVAIYQK